MDEKIKKCEQCNDTFGILRRRQLCKVCNQTVCDDCSKSRMLLPKINAAAASRVCDRCVKATASAARAAHAAKSGTVVTNGASSPPLAAPAVAVAVTAVPVVASPTSRSVTSSLPSAAAVASTTVASSLSTTNTNVAVSPPNSPPQSVSSVSSSLPAAAASSMSLARGSVTPPLSRGSSHSALLADEPSLSSSSSSMDNQHIGAIGADGNEMDLPLRLCLVILKQTAATMTDKYKTYRSVKSQRKDTDDPLTFRQFMFFSTIRTLPGFVFKKTKLAYFMMRADGGQLVQRDSFVRYAPVLEPLASKHDVHHIFDALQGGVGGDGVRYEEFKLYVDALHREEIKVADSWPALYDTSVTPVIDKSQKLLFIRTGVADSSGFTPNMGRLGVTPGFLVFESLLFKKRRQWAWSSIDRITWNDHGVFRKEDSKGMKIYIKECKEKGRESKECVVTLDMVGFGNEVKLERPRTFEYIRTMIIAHKLANGVIGDTMVSKSIIYETGETIRRQRALEFVGLPVDPMAVAPFRGGTIDEENDYVTAIRNECKRGEEIRKSKLHWLATVFPRLPQFTAASTAEAKQQLAEDIDPELKLDYRTLDTKEKTEEAFSPKVLAANLKLFKDQLEVIFAAHAAWSKLRNWNNVPATIFTILFLLNMAYQDFLGYLPAIVILLNAILLIVLRENPHALDKWLNDYREEDKPPQEAHDDDEGGLTSKMRGYWDVAKKTRDGLQSFQNWLAAQNMNMAKIGGLYKWRTVSPSTRLLIASIVGVFAFALIPFRFIFPIIVLDVFTTRFQQEGGFFERLVEQVELPDDASAPSAAAAIATPSATARDD